ncbi:spore germination protein [Shimazuella sp. AN120528]|uniref:GerAB/ArcD/ProY family transporter n=1 Tax=Shimazuella soli TaxID=1892854 RepID=UPI001F0F5F7F|nr:GerAB/ArcD/ProY family transporter [Shimazuella soli]MCH5586484.1 spore germination protein [Shimazuella soli]
MVKREDQITAYQAAVFVSSFMLGVGILILPRSVSEVVNSPDGWISLLLSGLFVILISIIMIKLCQRFPRKNFFEFSQEIVGKWAGGILNFILIAYFIMAAGFEIRGMAEVTKLFLLPATPIFATIIPFICLGTYLITGGINPIARFFELMLPITIIVLILVFALSIKSFDIHNLLPVMGSEIWPVIKGGKATFLSLTGFEVMLIITAFMKEPHKAVKTTIIGITIPVIVYLVAIICTIGNLGVEGTNIRTWPTVSLMREFEYPGILFERFETFLLAVWIIQIFTTFVSCYYFAALGLSQLFKKDNSLFIFSLAPLIYLVTRLPKNINDLFHFATFESSIIILFVVLILPTLLIIDVFRRKKKVSIS